jgi:hypothetical protein
MVAAYPHIRPTASLHKSLIAIFRILINIIGQTYGVAYNGKWDIKNQKNKFTGIRLIPMGHTVVRPHTVKNNAAIWGRWPVSSIPMSYICPATRTKGQDNTGKNEL